MKSSNPLASTSLRSPTLMRLTASGAENRCVEVCWTERPAWPTPPTTSRSSSTTHSTGLRIVLAMMSSELSRFERSRASSRPHLRWAASTGYRAWRVPKSDTNRAQAATSLGVEYTPGIRRRLPRHRAFVWADWRLAEGASPGSSSASRLKGETTRRIGGDDPARRERAPPLRSRTGKEESREERVFGLERHDPNEHQHQDRRYQDGVDQRQPLPRHVHEDGDDEAGLQDHEEEDEAPSEIALEAEIIDQVRTGAENEQPAPDHQI